MLDFGKFAGPIKAVVPIRNNSFILNKKPYQIKSDDGWFEVLIDGNKAQTCGHAYWDLPREKASNMVLGYTCNNSIVFQNFDVAKRKWNLGMTAPLHFNQSPTFESIRAVVWEDGQVYWVEPNYSDVQTLELKDLLDSDQTLVGRKGVTQELRSLFLFHALEKEQIKQLAIEAEMAKTRAIQKEEEERLMRDIPYRLRMTLARAGGEMLGYSLTGNRIIVEWKIPDSGQRYNSVIDSRTWMVLEAGFCMSNDDKRHNLTSIVKTAEEYEDRGVTFITRNR